MKASKKIVLGFVCACVAALVCATATAFAATDEGTEIELDSATVTVQKTFSGITKDQIPEDFAVVLTGTVGTQKPAYELKYGGSKNIGFEESTDGLTWTWTIEGCVPNKYTVSESGQDVEGFVVTTEGLSDTGITINADSVTITVTDLITRKDSNTFPWQEGAVFMTALTANGQEGTAVISETELSDAEKAAIETFLGMKTSDRGGLQNCFCTPAHFGTIADIESSGQPYVVDGRSFDYVDGNLVIGAQGDWAQVLFSSVLTKKNDPISITNTYEPATADIYLRATKELTGRDWKEGETFTFTLTDTTEEGAKLADPESKAVTESKPTAEFSAITFTKKDMGKTFFFTIEETSELSTGMTCENSIKVVIDVMQNDGAPLPIVEYYSVVDGVMDPLPLEKPVITNTYEPLPTEVELTATKVLNGMNEGVEAKTFTFNVFDADDQAIRTESVQGAGTVTFEAIPLTKAGTYTFTISEVQGTEPGYTYDPSVYTVTVKVEDFNGQLQVYALGATLDDEAVDNVVFTNEYAAAPTSIYLNANKVLVGKDLELGEFTFSVYNEADEVVATGTNDETGLVEFGEIVCTEPGEFELTVREDIGDEDGIEYDESEYVVSVTVTDNGEGQLEAVVNGADDLTFRNTYDDNGEDPKPDPDPDPDPDPSPDTGDSTPLAMLLGIMGIGVLGMVCAAVMRRRA